MKNPNEVIAQYGASKVEGRSGSCPRIGHYKIISLYSGICFGKPARMAVVNWKPDASGEFIYELTFHIQIESLLISKPEADLSNKIGQEFKVSKAEYFEEYKIFAVKWYFLPPAISTLDQLNKVLAENASSVNLDSIEDFDLELDQFDDLDLDGGY